MTRNSMVIGLVTAAAVLCGSVAHAEGPLNVVATLTDFGTIA
jgi:hypothetical protein